VTDDPYRDPRLYDLEYQDQTEDIDHYVALARRLGGPVLELGCGTGRISLPIARAGVEVDGMDASAPMLESLRERLTAEPAAVRARVHVEEGNFVALAPRRQYPLVLLPFNALHHCMDHRELLGLLDGARRALQPGGTLALDAYLPDPALYRRDPNRTYEHCTFVDPRDGAEIASWERSWYDALRQVHHVVYAYQRPDEPVREVHLALRVYYPQELLGLFDLAGFAARRLSSDFEGSRLTGGSLKLVGEFQLRDALNA
jgi:SAM-dependent methyltransferase